MEREHDENPLEPDDCALEDHEGDAILECLGKHDASEWHSCLLEGWGAFPHDGPCQCYRRLFVRVYGSPAEIFSTFRRLTFHLKECPETERVLFYVLLPEIGIPAFLERLRLVWHSFRPELERLLPAQPLAAPPVIRIAARGYDGLCFFTTNSRPAGGNALFNWWRANQPIQRRRLREAVQLIARLRVEQERHCAFIDEYTDQPAGLNGINALTFGDYSGRARRINRWQMRVYLWPQDAILPVGISGRMRHQNPPAMRSGFARQPGSVPWVAEDMANFYRNPSHYCS